MRIQPINLALKENRKFTRAAQPSQSVFICAHLWLNPKIYDSASRRGKSCPIVAVRA
jgi:hypothetical protein